MWSKPVDFYVAFLSAVSAPDWHGHNLDALWDGLSGGIWEKTQPLHVLVNQSVRFKNEQPEFTSAVEALFADQRSMYGNEVSIVFA